MKQTRTEYEETCEVQCQDNGRRVIAELLSFRPNEHLTVAIGRAIKLHMTWNKNTNNYVGTSAGMEFISTGPRSVTYRTGR